MHDFTIPDPQHLPGNTAYAACLIRAPQQRVWEVLTDFAGYKQWNRFTYDVVLERFEVGKEFTFTVNMTSWYQRRQRERIVRIEPPWLIAWGLPAPQNRWLNATRYQVITPQGNDSVHYQTWETFTGLLVPMLKMSVFGMVQRGFDLCARDLKAHCEART